MTRLRILLVAAACLAATAETPAFALNPQPLPPGRAINTTSHTTSQVFCKGTHFNR